MMLKDKTYMQHRRNKAYSLEQDKSKSVGKINSSIYTQNDSKFQSHMKHGVKWQETWLLSLLPWVKESQSKRWHP